MAETGVSVAQIQANAQWLLDIGRIGNDAKAFAKGNEQLGRTIGCFSDKVVHEDAKAVEIKDTERAEIKAAAEARVIQITKGAG
jgi:hypothetical protein